MCNSNFKSARFVILWWSTASSFLDIETISIFGMKFSIWLDIKLNHNYVKQTFELCLSQSINLKNYSVLCVLVNLLTIIKFVKVAAELSSAANSWNFKLKLFKNPRGWLNATDKYWWLLKIGLQTCNGKSATKPFPFFFTRKGKSLSHTK